MIRTLTARACHAPALRQLGSVEDRPRTLAEGAELAPTLISGTMAGQKINDVHSRVNFDEDEFLKAYAAKAIGVAELDLWAEFAKRWRAFYNDRAAGKTFTFFWPLDAKGLYATAEEFDKERYSLRGFLAKKAPDYVVGFDTEPVPPTPGGNSADWNQIIAWGGGVAILGGIIYLFGPAIHEASVAFAHKIAGRDHASEGERHANPDLYAGANVMQALQRDGWRMLSSSDFSIDHGSYSTTDPEWDILVSELRDEYPDAKRRAVILKNLKVFFEDYEEPPEGFADATEIRLLEVPDDIIGSFASVWYR